MKTLDTSFQDREDLDQGDLIERRNLQLIIGNEIKTQAQEDIKNQAISANTETITTTKHLAPICELILRIIISFISIHRPFIFHCLI